jgi:hypothetical protein
MTFEVIQPENMEFEQEWNRLIEDIYTGEIDQNGQTATNVHLGGVQYTIWNNETIHFGGVHVGAIVNGAYIINGNGGLGRL